jgi:O-antigen ligase
MPFFRSERGIGRGEVAESQLEVPIFAAFMVICCVGLVLQHMILGNQSLTIALSISMLVFGGTVLRVEVGLFVLLVAMLLSPEIELRPGSGGDRNVNIRYDDILILVIFIGVMIKLTFEGRLTLWQPSPINVAIVAYFSVCIFSTLLALERSLPAWDRRAAFFVLLKMMEFYLIFFMVAHSVRRSRDLRTPMTLFFLVMLIVSVFGMHSIGTTPRVSAPFEKGGTEPNTLGGYLVVCLCVALGLLIQAPGFKRKLLFLMLCGAGFVPLLYTLSRASYGGLIAGITVIALMSRQYAILAALAITLALSSAIMPEVVIERVMKTVQEEGGQEVVIAGQELGKVDKSTYERVHVWRKVAFLLSLGTEFFLFGGGVSWESVLDSQYARVLLETGFVGLFAFLFLQWRLLRTTREAYRWTEDWMARGIALGMFGATLALVVHSIGTISFLIVRIMEPYWFLIALTVSIRNEAITRHTARFLAKKQAAALEKAKAPSAPEIPAVEGAAASAVR